jgi:hypothetical protein
MEVHSLAGGVLVEVDDGTAGLSHETSRLQRVRSEI